MATFWHHRLHAKNNARMLTAGNARSGNARSGNARSGAVAAEFAVLLPFMAFLFAAVLDYARVYYCSQVAENCAHAGALYASGTAKSPTASYTVTDAARQAACAEGAGLSPPLSASQVDVALGNNNVTVTVNYDFTLLTPLLNRGGVLHLQRAVTMNKAPTAGN